MLMFCSWRRRVEITYACWRLISISSRTLTLNISHGWKSSLPSTISWYLKTGMSVCPAVRNWYIRLLLSWLYIYLPPSQEVCRYWLHSEDAVFQWHLQNIKLGWHHQRTLAAWPWNHWRTQRCLYLVSYTHYLPMLALCLGTMRLVHSNQCFRRFNMKSNIVGV